MAMPGAGKPASNYIGSTLGILPGLYRAYRNCTGFRVDVRGFGPFFLTAAWFLPSTMYVYPALEGLACGELCIYGFLIACLGTIEHEMFIFLVQH